VFYYLDLKTRLIISRFELMIAIPSSVSKKTQKLRTNCLIFTPPSFMTRNESCWFERIFIENNRIIQFKNFYLFFLLSFSPSLSLYTYTHPLTHIHFEHTYTRMDIPVNPRQIIFFYHLTLSFILFSFFPFFYSFCIHYHALQQTISDFIRRYDSVLLNLE